MTGERSRIARPARVVARNVAAIVVQAEAARAQLDRGPTAADAALEAGEDVGRQALADAPDPGVLRERDNAGELLEPRPVVNRITSSSSARATQSTVKRPSQARPERCRRASTSVYRSSKRRSASLRSHPATAIGIALSRSKRPRTPDESTPQPAGLNHFTCYPITYAAGSTHYAPRGAVSLQDEFANSPVNVKVGGPKLLCLPTEKIIQEASGGTVTYPIVNPNKHLLCFKVSETPFPPNVFDQNQFGSAEVNITGTNLLCLPSTKKIISTTKG